MLNIEKEAFNSIEFLAMLAHDMKTPIKAQLRALELLYEESFGKLGKETKAMIFNIIASNKYMQCLVDNVLNEYRMNKGELVLNITNNDIRKTIETSINNIGILSDVKNQKLNVKYFGNRFIYSYDEIEIQRVIINLISNAFEYSKENSIIEFLVKNNDDKLEVEIISPVNVSYKNKNSKITLNCLKAGTGLGLVICKRIIKLHKGEVDFKNIQNGYSAKFILY